RADLRLRRGKRACPPLLMLGCPFRREVAVEVEPLNRPRNFDLDAVEVEETALLQQAIEGAVVGPVDRVSPDQQALLLRMRAPGSVRILDPHVEHAAVTVDVLDLQSVLRLVARIGPDAGADEPPLLQPALRPVGSQ